MALWYLAHEDELLIDLDDATRPTKSGGPWIEMFFRRRLRDAIVSGKLDVAGVWLDRSSSPKHYHAAVRLAAPLSVFERLTWQLQLGSDLYRGRADLMRAARSIVGPSLLIRAEPIRDFDRAPDRECRCTEKHLTSAPPDCDVWRELRGMSPWELFGKSEMVPELAIGLPRGRVPMAAIMRRVTRGTDGKERQTGRESDRVSVLEI